jgi:lysophospholipase L1-like esterase
MRTRGRRILLASLAIALGASLGANAYLVHRSNAYFRATTEVRLDPGGLRTWATERADPPPPAPPTRRVLVFFGDSRALMWGVPAVDDLVVVNRGVGNQTTAQVLLRFDADVATLHPAVVVLEAGVNDLKSISELPERRAEIVADCEANLRVLVARCRGVGAAVVLTSVFAIGDVPVWRRPFWSDDVDAAVREVNTFLRTLAGDRVVFFDADPVLDDARGKIQPAYQYDFLHLDPQGYRALDTKLVPLVGTLAPFTTAP